MKRRVLSFPQSSVMKEIKMKLRVNWAFLFILTWGHPSCKNSTNVPSELIMVLPVLSDGERQPYVTPSVLQFQ